VRLYLIEINRYPPTQQEIFPYLPPFEFSEALNLMHIRSSDTHFRLHTDRTIDVIMRYVPDLISIYFRLYLIDLNCYPPMLQELFPYVPAFEFVEALNVDAYSPQKHGLSIHTDRLTL